MKYKFPSANISGIVSHILAYDMLILSMTPVDLDYIAELTGEFSEEEYEHLNSEYGLERVIE